VDGALPHAHGVERGQNLVEFALVFPILFLVLLAIFDMGRITYFASALHNAAREGARYGSLFPDDPDGVITRVEETALGIPVDELDVIVTTSPLTIQVSAAYTMPFITPVIGAFFSEANEIPLGSQATNPLEN
jgi:hypothetical protein